ncbi:MAG TPA: hypothetical protein VN914_03085 [Polyangia bacterium]|nr:hypothetical protein [Polyangia bacterium]
MHSRRPLAAFLFLAACASSPSSTSNSLAEEAAEVSQPGDPVVTLIEPGAEPRTRLRYRLSPGPQPPMVMEMKMSMAMAMGAMKAPVTRMPPITMIMSVDVTRVEPNGLTSNSMKVTSVEVADDPSAPPLLVSKLKEGLGKIVGMAMEADVTARGFARNVKVTMPPGTPPDMMSMADSMRQATQQATAPLPAEAVGTGARWKVVAQVDTGGFVLQQTSLMTLEQREEGRIVLAAAVEQTANPQPLKTPGLPPGASASLDSYSGSGQGKTDIRLDSRVPHATIGVQTKTASTIVMNETRSKMTMDLGFDVKIAPGPKK